MFETLGSGLGLATLFVAMLLSLELGRRTGRARLRDDPAYSHAGIGALEGAVFGLMGLLIAFTFSGASSRFDARRELLVKEANAIGTAWSRLDLLTPSARAALRDDFRRYVDLRLAATHEDASHADGAVATLQRKIWEQAVAAGWEERDGRVSVLLLPALNDMFDVSTARYIAVQNHPPVLIYVMLLILALVCAMLAGYGMAPGKRRSWLHILCFAGSLLMAIYVTMEIEFPRRGFIRIDHYDRLLVDLRETMKKP